MSEFNSREFGERIKKYRKEKGLSQENLATILGKTPGLVSRYESGMIIPDAKDVHKICEALEIYASDLYGTDQVYAPKKDSINPFKSNRLYMYFNAFNSATKKFQKDIWYIDIREKPDRVEVDFINPHNNAIYTTGLMYSDKMVAFLSVKNHLPNRQRLEISEFVININEGTDGLMLGTYMATNNEYVPSIRKCLFSEKKVDFTDEMFESLKLKDYEIEKLDQSLALYLDIFNK